jgi:hypothetical protein
LCPSREFPEAVEYGRFWEHRICAVNEHLNALQSFVCRKRLGRRRRDSGGAGRNVEVFSQHRDWHNQRVAARRATARPGFDFAQQFARRRLLRYWFGGGSGAYVEQKIVGTPLTPSCGSVGIG